MRQRIGRMRIKTNLFLILILLSSGSFGLAQTKGKIAGKVLDADNGLPLPGTNVLVVGTSLGAATDQNGDFYILNLTPGTYSVKAQMMGYESVIVEDIRVSVNRTSTVEIHLKRTVLEGQTVVVEAEKVTIKKDQTSTIKNVSSDQMDILPVEDLQSVVAMQAGIVLGHFRGGRDTEVAYLVDGMRVSDAFGGSGRAVDIQPEAVEDLEVITGTFNAEYGNAMSGIVNAVTKEGGNAIHGSASGTLGNYYTDHNDIFIGLDRSEVTRNQDYKVSLNGPILKDRLNFFVNYRYQNNKNHLNGIRRFNVDDYSNFSADEANGWYSEHNGDSAYVAMSRSINQAVMGKVTARLFKSLKLSLLYTLNDDEWHGYSHSFKYNPDGMAHSVRNSEMYAFSLDQMLSQSLFYELKISHMKNDYGNFVYEDPLDSNYVSDVYYNNVGPGFYTGGQQKDHTRRITQENSLKYDLNWQAGKHHSLKTGVLYTNHIIDNQYHQIRNHYANTDSESVYEFIIVDGKMKVNFPYYAPEILPDTSIYTDVYLVKPIECAAYLQDKMEFNEMVINIGLRYDYFDPNTVYPSQWRNPANQLSFPDNPERMSTYLKTTPKSQLSPRLGLSYQLGRTAVLHFSYGHFFQMPPMYALYQNHNFRISPTSYATVLGNPQLNAQKTVSYEVGLWQEIMTGMNIDVALFYRDIYDLLSAKVITTYNQIEYGLYSNKDYGNVRGLELKYDFMIGPMSTYINYTLQYTRGNADNPTQTFDRAGDSVDPVNRLIPMSWDQRHTLNVTVGYNKPKYGCTLTGYYNSGAPYTWTPLSESILAQVNLLPNNASMPARISFDLNSYYSFAIAGNLNLRLSMTVYNLFDRLNEVAVNSETGRAYTAIVQETDLASHRSDFNAYSDTYQDPSMYASPREVKISLGIVF